MKQTLFRCLPISFSFFFLQIFLGPSSSSFLYYTYFPFDDFVLSFLFFHTCFSSKQIFSFFFTLKPVYNCIGILHAKDHRLISFFHPLFFVLMAFSYFFERLLIFHHLLMIFAFLEPVPYIWSSFYFYEKNLDLETSFQAKIFFDSRMNSL